MRMLLFPKGAEREIFGADPDNDASAGAVLFCDMRLLALPVRSSDIAPSCLVTCPAVLLRFDRDLRLSGQATLTIKLRDLEERLRLSSPTKKNSALLGCQSGAVRLEELKPLEVVEHVSMENICAKFGDLLPHTEYLDLQKRMLVCSDELFSWFCSFAVPVRARNHLDPETKASKNLWHQESLPPDTLMYSLIGQRLGLPTANESPMKYANMLWDALPGDGNPGEQELKFAQFGGNETVGEGWFALKKNG